MKYGIVSCGDKAYFRIDTNDASLLIDSPGDSETLAIRRSWTEAGTLIRSG